MSDPNGEEAGIKFLAENKTKDGVITLPSGLQYKVLSEGSGLEHPTVSTPCECHYKGRLLDGTEFDSSYKRGTPTTFAPNQVIKGWTEAMQLMVVGDKWEMYIPYELAYGKGGKPPKIPAAACLVFVMEIIKIKGDTVPKTIEFPEWTEEQLKLWLEKDEASCNSWRDAKIKSWEDGGKLKETYPTREELDAWVSKQCKGVKDKALWKRTHKKEAPAEEQGPPKLTKESARKLLTEALATFKQPANKEKLEAILKECAESEAATGGEAGGMGGGMMKMMKLMPAVQEMMGATLQNYGFQASDTMTVVMQVQAFGAEDPSIAADVGKLMKAVQGDLTELLAE